MKKIALILSIGVHCLGMQAQQIDWVTTPSANVSEVWSVKADMGMFANVNEAGFSMSNAGTTTTLPNGTQRWQIGIRSDYATNIFAFISGLHLSNGDQLSVQSPDGNYYMLYDASDVGPDSALLTTPIAGDSMIVTVVSKQLSKVSLCIESVAVGFRSLPEHTYSGAHNLKTGYAASGSCEVSVTCTDGIESQKQAVCRVVMYGTGGSYWGTGTMMNNTASDGTPYLLTAAHVLDGDFKKCLAQFNYEAPLCQDIEPQTSATEQLQASTILVRNDTRDVLLLLFDDKPKEQTMVYYAGWNATTNLPSGNLYCIHHPQADVRMYSETSIATPNISYTADKTNDGESFDAQCHWKVNGWVVGATESGSSGSALFDADGHFVGALSGGMSSCKSQQRADYYWMLSESWEQLSPYLDPLSTGQTTLDGAFVNNSQTYITQYGATDDKVLKNNRIADDKGYIAGHNALGVTGLAQKFEPDSAQVSIDGLFVVPSKVMSVNGGTFSIAVWNSQTDGSIGELVASAEYQNSKMLANRESYFSFSDTVTISGSFYAGLLLNYDSSATDSIALYYQEGSGALFYNGQWQTATQLYSLSSDIQLFIGAKYVGKGQVITPENVDTTYTDPIQTDTTIPKDEADIKVTLKKISESSWQIEGNEIEQLMLYDVFGRRIRRIKGIEAYVYKLDLSSEARGIYMLRVVAKNEEKKFKLLNK